VAGLPADYDELKKLNIPILGDSAESAGSKYKGEYIGTQALMHSFSLHRSKIISSGEGGIITTNDKQCYELLCSYINHGYDNSKLPWEYKHKTLGLNFRMSNIHAALALSQLGRLDEYVKHRRKMAQIYDNLLEDKIDIQKYNKEIFYHNYFFYGVLVNNRDQIVKQMNDIGITVKTWAAIASQECYKQQDPPISKYIADHILLLPIHNQITEEQIQYTAKALIQLL
jgi:dTDP-4-amino-4,6-dideoxygalactose transaminase